MSDYIDEHLSICDTADRANLPVAGILARGENQTLPPVVEIVGATGVRPDLARTSELCVGLDPTLGLLAGNERVRSVPAALIGDWAAARAAATVIEAAPAQHVAYCQ